MTKAKPNHYIFPDLVNLIKSGEIQIPQFQREFVWSTQKSTGLLDSLLKVIRVVHLFYGKLKKN